jgi:tRNA dimethylallyltransferase
VGPTCSGKTKLGLLLAEKFNTEIISADSRQVYKKIDIGTAKPSKEELKKVKHHFISELQLDQKFDASYFEKTSEKIIDNLLNNNRIPLVVGGSGLYIRALIDGIVDSTQNDEELRYELLELRRRFGNEYLYNELKKIDPKSAENMLPQNWKRVMRAIEVYRLSGEPIWKHHLTQQKKNKYNFYQVGLMWEREMLYLNINLRVMKMFTDGLVEEVKGILSEGYSKDLNSLNTVGYKEVIDYLDGKISLEEAIVLVKRNTRRYAKRQMTWFNADKRIVWYKIENFNQLTDLAKQIEKDLHERQN